MLRTSRNGIFIVLVSLAGLTARANDSWVKDTLIVSLDETYGKYVDHLVEKKQTLFSLANAYGIDLFDVYDYNPILKTRILYAYDIIRIPISTNQIITDTSLLASGKKIRPVFYIIKPKDNLYRIAKVYFNMSFEDLINRNKLGSQQVRPGQKILIGWFDAEKKEESIPDYKPNIVKNEQTKLEQNWTEANPTGFTVEYKALDLEDQEWKNKYSEKSNNSDRLIEIKPEINPIEWKDRKEDPKIDVVSVSNESRPESRGILHNPNVVIKSKSKVLKRRMVTQNGVAQWAKSSYQTNDLYVLHPTAPVNSVVELTNPMTHRKIFAKVLSNMPAKLYSDDISVVVSPGVANLLGAIDGRFYVKLRFIEETIQ